MLAVLELNNGFLELKSGVGDSSRAFSTVLELEQAQEGLLGLKSGVGDPSRAFSTVLELKKAQEGVLGPSPPFLSSRRLKKGFWSSSRVSGTLGLLHRARRS